MTDLQSMSREQLIAVIAAMRTKTATSLSFKVSDKGGVSIYGLGRFPVTLFKSQWDRLLDPKTLDDLRAFITAHASVLTTKS